MSILVTQYLCRSGNSVQIVGELENWVVKDAVVQIQSILATTLIFVTLVTVMEKRDVLFVPAEVVST